MQVDTSRKISDLLFRVERNDKVGRFAVASSDLNPGDVIFAETPFAFGPKADSPPLCLGCYKPADCQNLCSSCKWPVCNNNCENIAAHKYGECAIFCKNKVRFHLVEDPKSACLQYECITPLRALLSIKNNPDRWEKEVKIMESHNTIRKTKPIWKFNQINIVNYLRGPCGLDFEEELIHSVCGILECNAFEARTISGHSIRCLFPNLAILSHNCLSNIRHSIVNTGTGDDQDFRVIVRAATKISKGEELYSSYTYSLWPTLIRREFLKESKYFDCMCERCRDPSELETHLSTIRCNNCSKGFLTSINPLDNIASWKCSNCNHTQNSDDVKSLFLRIQEEIDSAFNSNPQIRLRLLESLLQKYNQVLHSQHSFCCILRSSLIEMYGKIETCSEANMVMQKNYCTDLLSVINIIEPGYSRIRGITLYELSRSLVIIGSTNQDELKINFSKILIILKETIDILQLEPETSFEGNIGKRSKLLYDLLKNNFIDIINGKINPAILINKINV